MEQPFSSSPCVSTRSAVKVGYYVGFSFITRLCQPTAMTTIYHNPRCGTSRTVLQTLQERGLQPEIIEYLKTPLSRDQLAALISAAGLTVREAIRAKEDLFQELGLDDPALDDERLLQAMAQHPVLMNRPFVTTAKGTRLCRPAALVDELI